MGRHFRRLREDRGIDVRDTQTAVAHHGRNRPQELAAVHAAKTGIVIGKKRTDIAEARRADQRIADRVHEHVGVRMPGQPALVRNLDTAATAAHSLGVAQPEVWDGRAIDIALDDR